jgi:hypothetical protein
MKAQLFRSGLLPGFLCLIFAIWMASGPIAPTFAQTFGAIQAVRERASGFENNPEARGETPPAGPYSTPPGEQPYAQGASFGKLDTTYVPSTASLLLVIRPAQIMTAPVTQLLPIEVATAAGRQHLGIDPAEIDEVVVFGDLSNPMAPAYGAAIRFKNPFRATSIPPHARPMVQLADFNGKKYLQSSHPMMPSFYGPNNKTLLLAPDPVLRKMVETSTQPKSGQLLDRVREVPAGSDLYLAIDVATLRGAVPMLMGMSGTPMPPQLKSFLDSAAGIELTCNLVSRGPISLVVQCNDEPTAQQLEMMLAAAKQGMTAPAQGEQPAYDDPMAQANMQYVERIYQRFQPQRNGASITLLNIAADDPLQPQVFGIVMGMAMGASLKPAMEAAKRNMPAGPGAVPGAEGPEGTFPPGTVPGPEGSPPPEGLPAEPPVTPEGQPAGETERR